MYSNPEPFASIWGGHSGCISTVKYRVDLEPSKISPIHLPPYHGEQRRVTATDQRSTTSWQWIPSNLIKRNACHQWSSHQKRRNFEILYRLEETQCRSSARLVFSLTNGCVCRHSWRRSSIYNSRRKHRLLGDWSGRFRPWLKSIYFLPWVIPINSYAIRFKKCLRLLSVCYGH